MSETPLAELEKTEATAKVDWESKYAALEKTHLDTLAELDSLKDMITEDPVTQEILVTKSTALDKTRAGLESRKAAISSKDLSEYEKQVLRAEYQRQIEATNTQKETLQSYINTEMK